MPYGSAAQQSLPRYCCYKLATLLSEYRAKFDRLAGCLDDDLRLSPGIAVTVAPAPMLDTHVLNVGCEKALTEPGRPSPTEKRDLSRRRYQNHCWNHGFTPSTNA